MGSAKQVMGINRDLLSLAQVAMDEMIAREAPQSRGLSDLEKRWAFESGVVDPNLIRISEVDEIRKPDQPDLAFLFEKFGLLNSKTAGLTLGNFVLICKDFYSEHLLRHEFRHVYQWSTFAQSGDFLIEYFKQIKLYGYLNAPFEVEARSFKGRF